MLRATKRGEAEEDHIEASEITVVGERERPMQSHTTPTDWIAITKARVVS